jgi:SAM-dependent methyltransferase
MFDRSAELYDAIYDAIGKDYAGEADAVLSRIREARGSEPATLLDVACGTGRHLEYFSQTAACTGLDIEPGLLAVAGRRCPGVELVQGDMTDFDLGRTFDAVTCLFSSIGYVRTVAGLRRAAHRLTAHVGEGGVVVVEPWFTPEAWSGRRVQVVQAEGAGFTAVRMMNSSLEGGLSVLDAHYLIAGQSGVAHLTERHELGLFSLEQYADAFAAAGLSVSVDPEGVTGRGLIVALR